MDKNSYEIKRNDYNYEIELVVNPDGNVNDTIVHFLKQYNGAKSTDFKWFSNTIVIDESDPKQIFNKDMYAISINTKGKALKSLPVVIK